VSAVMGKSDQLEQVPLRKRTKSEYSIENPSEYSKNIVNKSKQPLDEVLEGVSGAIYTKKP
jgi:hypothetical protein